MVCAVVIICICLCLICTIINLSLIANCSPLLLCQFFLTTLRSPKEKLEYFVGIQVPKGQPAGVLDDVLTKEIVDKNKV